MARWIESWLPHSPAGSDDDGHPGERFGLPATGPNSVAGTGARIAGLVVDWLLAYVLVVAFLGTGAIGAPQTGWTVLLVWFVITTIAVALFGMTPGHVLLGLRVARTDMAAFVGVPRAALRTLLIACVFPPVFRDDDGRGWHDQAARTIVIRTR
ncbi:RDD family protein [Pseudonocardia phyllosphaerae]|uniref:RDD family protein n=1 Tax=Pseudonocardia phyllosphaerae TaxID=3390502 RepID=UPI0039784DA5